MNNLKKNLLVLTSLALLAACGGTQNLDELPVRDGPQNISPNPTAAVQ